MKIPKLSARVRTPLLFAFILFGLSLVNEFLLPSHSPVNGFNLSTFASVACFAGGAALCALARTYHRHDAAEFRRRSRNSQSPMT